MPQFQDLKGRTWHLNLTLGTVRKIRDEVGVDFLMLAEAKDNTMLRLLSDVELLVGAVYAACESQAKEHGVSPEEFGEGMGGEVFDKAADALLAAIADFFPNATRREALRSLVAITKETQEKAVGLAQAAMLDGTLARNIDRGLAQAGERLRHQLEQSAVSGGTS